MNGLIIVIKKMFFYRVIVSHSRSRLEGWVSTIENRSSGKGGTSKKV